LVESKNPAIERKTKKKLFVESKTVFKKNCFPVVESKNVP